MRTQRHNTFISRVVIGSIAALTFTTSGFAVDVVDDPVQIDERAAQVIQTSNVLCWEMHRYHQDQPSFAQTYRSAKEIWTRAGELRDALRAGPVETEMLNERLNEMNDIFKQLETTLSKWGDGDRSLVANSSGPSQRTVVTEGTTVDLPLLGIHVGRPRMVVENVDTPQLARHRLHPNSVGSKRSLQRELAATKVALSYLIEDANVVAPANGPEGADSQAPELDADAGTATNPTPEPPVPGETLENPQPIPATSKNP